MAFDHYHMTTSAGTSDNFCRQPICTSLHTAYEMADVVHILFCNINAAELAFQTTSLPCFNTDTHHKLAEGMFPPKLTQSRTVFT